MTAQKVEPDARAVGVGYAAGLLALLLWPNRQSADQFVVLLVGIVIFLLVGMSVDWLAFKWRPSFDVLAFVTQTGAGVSRPLRYSIPNVLGLATALIFADWLRATGLADWGLTAYAVGTLLLVGGFLASNLLWERASKSGSADIPAR